MRNDEKTSQALIGFSQMSPILRAAFEKRMTRKCVWDLRDLSGLELEIHQTAARYYMRGIECIPPYMKARIFSTEPKFFINGSPTKEFFQALENSFVVCDANVYKAWPQFFFKTPDFLFHDPSEAKKNLDTVEKLLKLSENSIKKPWIIIGGGITCDLAAFAAHVMEVEFILVPTTLLAMIDASIGGKTGVNFPPYGKNLVGAFAFAEEVWIFTCWLESLPKEQFYAGAAECMKHAILSKDKERLKDLTKSFAHYDIGNLLKFLPFLLDVKAQIVRRDPFEKGERAVLNLGHTLAHALEAVSHEILHGEAVAVGIVFESFLSTTLGYQTQMEHETLKNLMKESQTLLNRRSLENKLQHALDSEFLLEKLCFHMQFDKKTTNKEQIPFVLLGSSSWLVDVPITKVCDAWRGFLAGHVH